MFEADELQLPSVFANPNTDGLTRLFFDIEGSLGVYGDVLQLSYILTDWSFNIIEIYSKYFRNFVPISQEEANVHKLTEDFLWTHADHHFSLEIPNLDVFRKENIMFVSFSDFDTRKLVSQCTRYEIPPFEFGARANSLKTLPKKRNWFDAQSINGGSLYRSTNSDQREEAATATGFHAHNALYDTHLTYILCRDYFLKMP